MSLRRKFEEMKEHTRALGEWITTRWNWYVKGHYHCDHCPYCWEDWSCEGDCDCGCYIKGDLYDTCRLIPPFRTIVGWPKMRYAQYWEGHAYDGMADWYEENIHRQEVFAESVNILLRKTELCRRDSEGKLFPICKADLSEAYTFVNGEFFEAFTHYEDHAHPYKVIPLKQQWKDLIRLTWKQKVYEKIAPYLPRKKRK